MASLERRPLGGELPPAMPRAGVALRALDLPQVLVTATAAAGLPAPGRASDGESYAVWQAPDRWLLVGAQPLPAADLASDLTDGLALFEIEGPGARAVLQQAMTYDLAQLAPGQAAVTLFAGLRATVYPWRSAERWRLHVERASARYAWDWLATAASAAG